MSKHAQQPACVGWEQGAAVNVRIKWTRNSEAPMQLRTSRLIKIAGVIIGCVFALLLVICVGIYFYIQANGLKQLTERGSAALGRPITIGSLNIGWGRTTHVSLTDVKVDNVEWGSTAHFLEAKSIDLDLRLWPILTGHFVLPKLVVDEPKLFLERGAKGQVNWSFGAQPIVDTAAKIAAPEQRSEMPSIDYLDIRDGIVQYKDAAKKLQLDGKLAFGTGEASGPQTVNFKGKGELEGRELSVEFNGGSFLMLQQSKEPYPLKLSIRYGDTAIDIEGTAKDPIALQGTDLKLKLKGPDLADVFPVLGVPAPPTPPYRLEGELFRDKDLWRFENFAGIVGDSDLKGSLSIDYGRKKPFLKARLTSKLLDLDDLGPLVGLPPKTEGKEAASEEQKQEAQQMAASDNIFPHLPLKVEKLKVMDMDVTLTAAKVNSQSYLAVSSLDGHVIIDNGKAAVDPIKLAVAAGDIAGRLSLDANPRPPAVSADLALSKLDLATFFKSSKYFDATSGKIDGRVQLSGFGQSLADVMGTSNGEVRAVMNGASISALLVELIGLDLEHALILYITEDHKIPIRCAAGRIVFSKGEATFAPFIMDTTKSVLNFHGVVNLKRQTMKIQVDADGKDFSLLNIAAPVQAEGKIRDPNISLGPGVPIPLIDPGNAKNVPCEQLAQSVLTTQ
jgi:uncharacterized protein involved in outer membrane biogenesis